MKIKLILLRNALPVLFQLFLSPNLSADSYMLQADMPARKETLALARHQVHYPHIEPGSCLYTSLGIPRKQWESDPGPFEYEITLKQNSSKASLLKGIIDPAKNMNQRGWNSFRIPVPAKAGGPAQIKFRIDSLSKGHKGNEQAGFWGGTRLGNFKRKKNEYNILLISIDTLRADHLGAAGYPRDTSPNIDRLAQGGVYFKKAVAQSSWTKPSHMSLFTGLYPSFHSIDLRLRQPGGTRRLSTNFKTLPQYLQDHEYLTQAFTGSIYLASLFGFDRGFDNYQEPVLAHKGDAEFVFGNALSWLSQHADEKFFLFLHTYEVHQPYRHEFFLKPGLAKNKILEAQYDSGIRFVDDQIGTVINKLESLNLLDETIVVVLSDHGEDLDRFPVKMRHGHSLYDDLLLVPLIFHNRRLFKARTINTYQAQLIDVMPTLLDLVGAGEPTQGQGHKLSPMLKGEPIPTESYAISELVYANDKSAARSDFLPLYRDLDFDKLLDPKQETEVLAKSPRLFDSLLHDTALVKGANEAGDCRLESFRWTGTGAWKLILAPSIISGKNRRKDFPDSRQDTVWSKHVLPAKGRELYDLKADPAETTNASFTNPEMTDNLENKLRAIIPIQKSGPSSASPTPKKEIDPQFLEEMKSLGY